MFLIFTVHISQLVLVCRREGTTPPADRMRGSVYLVSSLLVW